LDDDRIRASLVETARVMERLGAETVPAIRRAGEALRGVVSGGGKILLCGNGGSAADAQHVATELCVRYLVPRRALPAIALTVDTSVLTACANDLGFEHVFARQVEALGEAGDALIAISTSGNSPNVLRAVEVARGLGLVTVGLTGESGGALGSRVQHWIAAPASRTPRVQEAHLAIEHLLCEIVEEGSG
jgi:D-sedoheptulose 7-phosphate isomerase